jgi:ornithine cyclodeaminase/alanine dehydrogenase-like protein (mu-crystallin family)
MKATASKHIGDMMAAALTLRLSSRQTLCALADVELLEVLADRLAYPDRPAHPDRGAQVMFGVAAAGQTVVEDPETGLRCLLPAAMLRMIRAAGLAALASRELAAPGVLTAAVFGTGTAIQVQIAVMAHYLPMLSHIALGSGGQEPAVTSVLDELERAGIGLSAAADPERAALGANLLIAVTPSPDPLRIGPLPLGALVVNATGQDLPPDVVACASRIYVDDLALLERNRHREFVARHLAGPDARPDARSDAGPDAGPDAGGGPLLGHREGWYRHPVAGHGYQPVRADLGMVLAGAAPGRLDDEILLVELLGAEAVDAALAGQIGRAAAEHDLGSWIELP